MKLFSRKSKKIYFAPDFYYENTQDFCLHLGLTPEDVADLTGYSVQTTRRWIRTGKHEKWLLPFLYATDGHVLSPGFDGWCFKDSTLACPGWRFTLNASQVDTYRWKMESMAQAYSEIRMLKKELARLKGTPKQCAEIIQLRDFKNLKN